MSWDITCLLLLLALRYYNFSIIQRSEDPPWSYKHQLRYLPTAYLRPTRNIFKATNTSTYRDGTHPPLPPYPPPTTNDSNSRPPPNETQRGRRWWWSRRRRKRIDKQTRRPRTPLELENRGSGLGRSPVTAPVNILHSPAPLFRLKAALPAGRCIIE